MPIQREKVTEWPIIPGSSIKGVQREHYRAKGQDTFVQKYLVHKEIKMEAQEQS